MFLPIPDGGLAATPDRIRPRLKNGENDAGEFRGAEAGSFGRAETSQRRPIVGRRKRLFRTTFDDLDATICSAGGRRRGHSRRIENFVHGKKVLVL